jgi:S1-C subfamily serine protease
LRPIVTTIVGAIALAVIAGVVALRVFRPEPVGDSLKTIPTTAPSAQTPDGALTQGAPTEQPAIPAVEPPAASQPIYFPAPVAAAPSPAPAPISEASRALEDIVSASIPAIVSIETSGGRGSGFFAAPRTLITNAHVVAGNVSVTVKLPSGQTLPGRVETTSDAYDLAVVRVDGIPPSHPVLPLGSVETVRPGQEVIAIGLAMGVFQNTVTRGIISAVRRSGSTVVLQTDAAINPGNSGGPLLNRNGQVIGITTLKLAGAAESLGFAVAIDHARTLLSGGRAPAATPMASVPVSDPLAPAFAGRSSTDQMRDQGARTYDQNVQIVAQRAAQLDDYWNRIKQSCSVRAAPGYDREWFGLWDGRTELTAPDPSCTAAVRDLNGLADEIRRAMAVAQEHARRASVLPGQLREIRHRYRMDWTGWDR